MNNETSSKCGLGLIDQTVEELLVGEVIVIRPSDNSWLLPEIHEWSHKILNYLSNELFESSLIIIVDLLSYNIALGESGQLFRICNKVIDNSFTLLCVVGLAVS